MICGSVRTSDRLYGRSAKKAPTALPYSVPFRSAFEWLPGQSRNAHSLEVRAKLSCGNASSDAKHCIPRWLAGLRGPERKWLAGGWEPELSSDSLSYMSSVCHVHCTQEGLAAASWPKPCARMTITTSKRLQKHADRSSCLS